MTKPLSLVNVGVDVSKDKLDVHLLERDLSLSVPNQEPAIAAIIKRLARYRLERIVIEATGRLEHAFVSAAIAKGLPVVVVAPLKVRRFAQAAGQLAKTDAIDARLIARFAAALKPAARPAIDANSQNIKDLVVRRRQLTSLRTTEKNRAA
jgi:transposase